MKEKLEEFKNRVEDKKRYSLSMSRVPKKTLEKFKALADEEYSGDYGMTLKSLMDKVDDFNNGIKMQLDNLYTISNLLNHKIDYIVGKNVGVIGNE